MKNDVTQIKQELCDEGSSLNSSLDHLSKSFSLLEESMSRNEEKHVMSLKNIKKDVSVLSSDMLEREKKRQQEREHDKQEIKEEIQKK